ncbi:MAG: outer membrane lipoprotein-sorting protein [Deltaproteobacteria bacterium]|nr:outer membrane lipoprotein-sorting protein [Deltaproteobacteria bacterium]
MESASRGARLPLLLAVTASALLAAASDPAPASVPGEDAVPRDDLSAEEIYSRVLANRFDAFVEEILLASRGAKGAAQKVGLRLWWRYYPEGHEAREKDVVAKVLARYFEPRDLRKNGYLVINRAVGAHDQFVYLPSRRKVRRVNMSTQDIAGTDFALEDIIPHEMDDATYERVDDAAEQGTLCWVIEATPKPEIDSQYSRFRLYVEREHYVPIKTRYWDHQGVEVKELVAPLDGIEEIDGVWLAMRRTARNLVELTETELHIARIVPVPDLAESTFSQRRLTAKRSPPVPWDESGD